MLLDFARARERGWFSSKWLLDFQIRGNFSMYVNLKGLS